MTWHVILLPASAGFNLRWAQYLLHVFAPAAVTLILSN